MAVVKMISSLNMKRQVEATLNQLKVFSTGNLMENSRCINPRDNGANYPVIFCSPVCSCCLLFEPQWAGSHALYWSASITSRWRPDASNEASVDISSSFGTANLVTNLVEGLAVQWAVRKVKTQAVSMSAEGISHGLPVEMVRAFPAFTFPGGPELWGPVTKQLCEEALHGGSAAFQEQAGKHSASPMKSWTGALECCCPGSQSSVNPALVNTIILFLMWIELE